MADSPAKVKRLDIQGLRAVAVLVVVADHLVAWPSGGFAGVDIFFVISGFLITGILLREYEKTGSISFARFYASRTKRILPAATLVLIATAVAAFAFFAQPRAVSVAWDAFWAFFFGANWNFAAKGTDYFQQDAAVSPLQHFWSLSVEEQFYFVWPWLLLGLLVLAARMVGRVRVRTIAGIAMALIVVASFSWALAQSIASPGTAYFSTFTRAWELGIGALLAIASPWFERIPQLIRIVLAYGGMAGIAASMFLIDPATTWPAPWALLPVLATTLVIASGIGAEARFNPWLRNPVMVYIGDISYSLYLWHFPVIVFAATLFPDAGPLGYLTTFVVGFALASAAYHALEKPLHTMPLWAPRRQANAWASWRAKNRRPALLGGAAAVITVAALVTAVVLPQSGPVAATEYTDDGSRSSDQAALTGQIVDALNASEWPEDIAAQVSESADWDPEVRACADPATMAPGGCTWGDGDKLALVVGDSVANSYVPILRDILLPEGWTVVQLTLNGCEFNEMILASERSAPLCPARIEEAITATQAMNPDVVFVSSQWATHRVLGQPKAVPFDDWWSGASEALDRIAAPTVYIGPPPYQKALDSCYSSISTPAACVSHVNETWMLSDKAVAEMAAESDTLTYVSSEQWFCYDQACPSFVDGLVTRSDLVHPGQPFLEEALPAIRSDILQSLP